MDESLRWFKSSHSNMASHCVEVGYRGTGPEEWIKSSHSSMENAHCVEVALREHGSVLVRDTGNRDAAVVGLGAREWSALVAAVASCR
ncbi:DUF397 domain-containing protein [Nocardiopsis sp. NPDC007018]|uniref:DUF397 domain-containing protein n=1 Tax=Nocardiopsis sp. NPDC007018 TaxID=3155721 RepID=UPI0033DA6C67